MNLGKIQGKKSINFSNKVDVHCGSFHQTPNRI